MRLGAFVRSRRILCVSSPIRYSLLERFVWRFAILVQLPPVCGTRCYFGDYGSPSIASGVVSMSMGYLGTDTDAPFMSLTSLVHPLLSAPFLPASPIYRDGTRERSWMKRIVMLPTAQVHHFRLPGNKFGGLVGRGTDRPTPAPQKFRHGMVESTVGPARLSIR